MKKLLSIITLLAFTSVAVVSCKDDKDDETPSPTSGTVTIELTNIAGNKNVDTTGSTSYVNAFGEKFTVKRLKYYISNVRLVKNGVVSYTMPESYFLVDESKPESTILTIPNVPNGSYTDLYFDLGVDSARNVSGAQSGALTPSDMFWSWSTGYIFFKLEGFSPDATTTPGGPDSTLIYHIAGFKEPYNALRPIEVSFQGASLVVDGTREAEIHVFADILKVFSGIHSIKIDEHSNVMTVGSVSSEIADNYGTMFTFGHLHN